MVIYLIIASKRELYVSNNVLTISNNYMSNDNVRVKENEKCIYKKVK